ncbi:galectin-9C-like isoform X2 [Carcharodon carcharias]|uniref:galectin-9C-like isoform X2 n=1 Tax=Carcharodon carcharias TaxID=13397 RepID=UPI001B7DE21D|nr:galectin-9C-like isoform X2 [Carcharodon carcharias]
MDFYPQPVYNPVIPYTGPIPGGLQDGKMIMIKGRVLPDCKRFHVNLQCGSMTQNCDVAFHFNPRYEGSGYVVCNTFENQDWASEERKFEMPIQKGETFQLLILVQADCYKVAVNDKHFLEFIHRIPFSRVDTIAIDGQVEVISLSFINSNQVPFKTLIPGGLAVLRTIFIQGTVKPNCDNFFINLKPSNSLDIAFHVSPRFRTEHVVVRNNRKQNSWGTEERTLPENPFSPGQPFELTILCEPSFFRISVNGRHAFDFNHRYQPIQLIDELEIGGDVTLTAVRF